MKEIFVNNYKWLILYKTFLFNHHTFKTKSHDDNLIAITNALNIKKRNKRIEYIYDYACEQLDKYYSDKNTCKFVNGQCRNQQGSDCKYNNGCCRLCMYQSSKGCKTSNLTCKLFYCDSVFNEFKVLRMRDIPILKLLTARQRLILRYDFFSSRENVLLDLKIGMISFYGIRIFFNIIKTLFVLPKIRKNLNEEQNI